FAPHQRTCANGKSTLTVNTLTFSKPAASSLKRRVCASHTPVSSEGTTLIKRTEPFESASVTGDKSFAKTVNSGALSPTFTSFPNKVTGLFLNVIDAILPKSSFKKYVQNKSYL